MKGRTKWHIPTQCGGDKPLPRDEKFEESMWTVVRRREQHSKTLSLMVSLSDSKA